MSTPYQSFCGRMCEAEVLGQRWKFARWTWRIIDLWTEWAQEQLPNPITKAIAAIEHMDKEELERKITDPRVLASRNKIKDELVNAAMKQAGNYLGFTSAEVQALINSPRGAAHLVVLLLIENHPDITDEKALDIITALGPEQFERILITTAGRSPPGRQGNGSAPVGLFLPSRGG